MNVDIRTAVVLKNTQSGEIALLKRSPEKKLLPNLVTGVGGKVELHLREGEDLDASALRELREEVGLASDDIANVRLRLITTLVRDNTLFVLIWYTATLIGEHPDLVCTEGELFWRKPNNLTDVAFTPTSQQAIPFLVSLSDSDATMYCVVFDETEQVLTAN